MQILPEMLSGIREEHADQRISLTGGVYDLLHPGHVQRLEVARAISDIVVVGVWSDEQVARRKGPTRPFNGIIDRLRMVDAMKPVDYVLELSGEGRRSDIVVPLIRRLEPDVYILGDPAASYDDTPFIEHPSGRFTSMVYDTTYRKKSNSTSLIAEKIMTGATDVTVPKNKQA